VSHEPHQVIARDTRTMQRVLIFMAYS